MVVEWSELLARGRFTEALANFPAWDYSISPIPTFKDIDQFITGYGSVEPYPSGEIFTVTPILSRPEAKEMIQR